MNRAISVFIALGRKKNGIRIINIPPNDRALVQIVDILRAKGVNISYTGETNGVLAYNYLKQITRPH